MKIKQLSIVVVGVALTGTLICLGLYLLVYLSVAGIWPFEPLMRKTNQIKLPNGGVMIINAIEDRGPRSEEWRVSAEYQDPDSLEMEKVGEWFGSNISPKVYYQKGLVVLLNPNRETMHVRTLAKSWRVFSMIFPTPQGSLPLTFYETVTALSGSEIQRILKVCDPDEDSHIPSFQIQEFQPDQYQLAVTCYIGVDQSAVINLRLSPDGERLSLLSPTV